MMYRQVHVNHSVADPKFYAKLFGVDHCEPRKSPKRLRSHDVFVYDVHEIEAGVQSDEYSHQGRTFKRYTSYMRRHPNSTMFVDLSSENISLVLGVYRQFMDTLMDHVKPQQVVVACSQRDILTQLQYRYRGIVVHHYSYWETYTRFESDERGWPEAQQPQHRFSCLNRRYAAHRAWLLFNLRHRITQPDFVYSFSQSPAWTNDDPAQHVAAELQTMDEHSADLIRRWQNHSQPWQSLDCEFSYFNHDVVWQTILNSEINIATETVVHNRTQRSSAFLTEKTFTPLALGRAVIVYGSNTADLTLAEFGYRPSTDCSATDLDWQRRGIHIAESIDTVSVDWRAVEHNQQNFLERTRNTVPPLPEIT